MNIGFIGIGQMGRHMARRIMEAKYSLVVNDLNKDAAGSIIGKGAVWADTPSELAEKCNIIFSCLPTPQSVSNIVFGENGLQKSWKKGDMYIDMSTNSPSLLREIADAGKKDGVVVMDAPVSGGTGGADAGTLTIMVGGEAEAFESVKGLFETMGKNIVHVGDVGCGNVAKLVNNMISLGCNSISAEGFALGVKAGIDPMVLYDIVSTSTGNNWCMQQYPKTTFQGNFEPGFRMTLAFKDINLALELGREHNVPLPVAETVRQDMEDTINAGYADKGVDAVILPIENAINVEVRRKQ